MQFIRTFFHKTFRRRKGSSPEPESKRRPVSASRQVACPPVMEAAGVGPSEGKAGCLCVDALTYGSSTIGVWQRDVGAPTVNMRRGKPRNPLVLTSLPMSEPLSLTGGSVAVQRGWDPHDNACPPGIVG